MRKFWKWAGLAGGGLLALGLLVAVYIYFASSARLDRVYEITAAAVLIPAEEAEVERGRHLVSTRGCQHCHGMDLGGEIALDDPMIGRIAGSNLTSGEGGIGSTYTDEDWVRAIRHGVNPAGRALLMMPSYEYFYFSDEDLGAILAYLKQIPPVDRRLPKSRVGPLGRTLILAGQIPLAAEMIEHDSQRPDVPAIGETAAYGEYLAKTMCIGCHGADLTGGPIPGGSPEWPPAANLRQHPDGLGSWTQADFTLALKEGIRPDGEEIDPAMPRDLGQLTEVEIAALWRYLETLSADSEAN